MPDSETRAQGKQIFSEVTQLEPLEVEDQFMVENMDQCFAGLWGRPGLSRRERRFLSLATVAARGMDLETQFHVKGALASGDISAAEMMEIILHVRQYAGWPAGATLYRHYRAACAELGLEVPAADEAG